MARKYTTSYREVVETATGRRFHCALTITEASSRTDCPSPLLKTYLDQADTTTGDALSKKSGGPRWNYWKKSTRG